MKTTALALLLFSVSGSAFATNTNIEAIDYQVSVTVEDSESKLNFPTFKFDSFGQEVTSQTEECIYSGVLSKHEANAILLEAKMSCDYENGESSSNLPVFILNKEGGEASIELGEDEANLRKYTVLIKALN
ncbi:hypothetical protein L8R80_11005 [Vibrio splendidus]|uniref:hypothetical protein n=1 Tax=Vibrio splendidus TaxID=29497 RepID=UPI000C83F979|nr:hypothetical protein [Vibrio splendidus]MDH5911763.1 hypothetical protein [Vibrio splendidus]MDH5941805.1 hypothetical protein [Vibrio splendidus]MDH5986001.1 hypothetical protein [Vibrio splendidus]MDH5993769.1 hypothetical protein [Vibrio splendidus]MDH6004705.1 hypothetical protein [Vibrio splendidus]